VQLLLEIMASLPDFIPVHELHRRF